MIPSENPAARKEAMDRFFYDLQSFAIERGMQLGVCVETTLTVNKTEDSFSMLISACPSMAPLPPVGKFLKQADAERAASAIQMFHQVKINNAPWWWASRSIGRMFRTGNSLYRFYGYEYKVEENKLRALAYRLATGSFELLQVPKRAENDVNRPIYSTNPATWAFLSEQATLEVESYFKQAAPRVRGRSNDRDLFKNIFY